MRDEDQPVAALASLREVESPELVRVAVRRFRRRLLLWAGVVVAALVGLVLLLTAPAVAPGLPERLAASGPVSVMERIEQDPVEVLVLQAARLENSYALRLVVTASGLADDEGVFVAQRFAVSPPDTFDEEPEPGDAAPPPPGPPPDLGGVVSIADSGFGASLVQEAWVEAPLGTRRLTVTVGAGVPARPGSDLPPADTEGDTWVLSGPPTEPGTQRVLAEVELDLTELGLVDDIWRN